MRDRSQRIAAQGTGRLGVTFAVGLAISLWSAAAGIKAIIDALDIAYEEEEGRSFLRLAAEALLLTLGAELNAEIEHQTRVDATTDPRKQMGERRAKMADTAGGARGQP